ncbi:MAG: hypothetical protein ACRCV0_01775 [Brevinema sp.]
MLEARKQSFKIGSNIREYSFTDEDKLAFSMDEREFFDLFDRQDQGLGEYLRYIHQETRSSSLPDKIALNHKLNGSCTHHDLMDKIQRSWSKKVVSLGEVSEKILKEIGYSSPSSSQISDLAKKIADENRLNGDPAKAYIFRDQLGKLATKILNELYTQKELTSEQKRDLEKGFYKVSEVDKFMFKINKDLFWNRFYRDSSDKSTNEEARKVVGLSVDQLESDRIFIVTKMGLDKIAVLYKNGVSNTLNTTYTRRLKSIGVYANYLAKSNIINELVISSMARTEIEQAEFVYQDAIAYPIIPHDEALYNGNTGIVARKYIKEGFSKSQVLEKIIEEGIRKNPVGFKHISNSGNVIDLGAGDSRQTRHPKFKESFIKFQNTDKFIYSANSIAWGDRGEKNAYHIVFKN